MTPIIHDDGVVACKRERLHRRIKDGEVTGTESRGALILQDGLSLRRLIPLGWSQCQSWGTFSGLGTNCLEGLLSDFWINTYDERNPNGCNPSAQHGGVFAASPQNPTGGAAALAIKGRRRRPLWIFAASSSATDPQRKLAAWESGHSTLEFTGLRGFSRMSAGMMGWAAHPHIFCGSPPG